MMNRDGSCGLSREERGFRRVSGLQTTCIMIAFCISQCKIWYGVCSVQHAASSVQHRREVRGVGDEARSETGRV